MFFLWFFNRLMYKIVVKLGKDVEESNGPFTRVISLRFLVRFSPYGGYTSMKMRESQQKSLVWTGLKIILIYDVMKRRLLVFHVGITRSRILFFTCFYLYQQRGSMVFTRLSVILSFQSGKGYLTLTLVLLKISLNLLLHNCDTKFSLSTESWPLINSFCEIKNNVKCANTNPSTNSRLVIQPDTGHRVINNVANMTER